MNEPSHRDDPLARLSDAIGLPRPQGWAAPAVRWLAVWCLGNIGWIVGGLATSVHLPGFRPPPGWAYWVLWCVVGGAIVTASIPVLARVRPSGGQSWLWFGVLSLAMCLLEEALCYLTGTGMWEGRSRFWPEFGVGVSVLMGWAVGSGLVLRFSGLGVWEVLPCGFSGWLGEAFVVPRFLGAPLLLIWIIPLSIVSYLLPILPGMVVVGGDLPQPSAILRWRPYLVALLVPVGSWFVIALVWGLFVKL